LAGDATASPSSYATGGRVSDSSTKFEKFSFLGLGTHLFVKVPQPGDSKVTFPSSS